MAREKSTQRASELTISEAMSICLKNGIKAWVVHGMRGFLIYYSINGKVRHYNKRLRSNREANEALRKTSINFANKFTIDTKPKKHR